MDFKRILTNGPITIDYLDGAGDDLVISFASIGHDATRAPSPEFVATAIGKGSSAFPRKALFVSDAARSWANAPQLAPALQKAVAQIAPQGRIAAIGLSMGGFAALAAAQTIRLDAVLAFGPQYALTPDLMPDETRWRPWSAQLRPALYPTCPLPAPPCWSVICHGLIDDREQALAFTPAPSVDHVLFPERDHGDLVAHLKQRGVLAGLMEAMMAPDRVRLLRIASSAGGKLRHKWGL